MESGTLNLLRSLLKVRLRFSNSNTLCFLIRSIIVKNSIELLSKHDSYLAEIISKVEVDKHISTANVFNDLIGCIIEQQIHYRSTKNIYFNLLEKAGVTELMPSSFDQFEALSLSGTKLSVNKLAT